jgi:deoxyhypusine synthase
MGSAPPATATDAVLVASEPVPDAAAQVRGIDWASLPAEHRTIISGFVDQLTGQGFQSSSIGEAIRIINDMVGSICVHLGVAVLTASRDHGATPRPTRGPPSFLATPRT